MKKLIATRQGAVAYVVSPLLCLMMLAPMLLLATPDPFAPPLLEAEQLPLALAAVGLACFALPTLVVMLNACARSFPGGRPQGVQWLLLVLLSVAVWFPAALLCIPLYVVNLVCLARKRYPAGAPFPWKLCRAAVMVLLVFVVIGSAQNLQPKQPQPTAAEAYRLYQPNADLLAEIPLGEDAVLLISQSGSGEFTRTDEGWTLRTAYTTEVSVAKPYAASLVICHNPSDGPDVVILSTMQRTGSSVRQPHDTAGSAFTLITEDVAAATLYTWYTLADADAPGYAVTFE